MPKAKPACPQGATSGYVPVRRLDMSYEIHSGGSPLILLHGAMGTIDSCFADLLPVLAATAHYHERGLLDIAGAAGCRRVETDGRIAHDQPSG